MKWKPISELTPDKEVLFRIETDDNDIVYTGGSLENDWRLNVINYAGYDNYFDNCYLCNITQLQRYGIKSICFADPKEIEL